MFAAAMPKKPIDVLSGEWYAEEKIDGHRLIAHVDHTGARAWSRNGLARPLPEHIQSALLELPYGTYDGELYVPGSRSYGVKEIVNAPSLVYNVFDVLGTKNGDATGATYLERRSYLATTVPIDGPVHTGWAVRIDSSVQLAKLLNEVWERDGEGLILKHTGAIYIPGGRPKNTWIKMKQLQAAVLKVVGFVPSKGKINDRGLFATVVLRDTEGNHTVVKTKNDVECAAFERQAEAGEHAMGEVRLPLLGKVKYHYGILVQSEFTLGFPSVREHLAIGRELRIEFQERTDDGSYRHPRWDRWENE